MSPTRVGRSSAIFKRRTRAGERVPGRPPSAFTGLKQKEERCRPKAEARGCRHGSHGSGRIAPRRDPRAVGTRCSPIARSTGVDVVSGEGLDEALVGAEPSSTRRPGPRPTRKEATATSPPRRGAWSESAPRPGEVDVVVSIIGIEQPQGRLQRSRRWRRSRRRSKARSRSGSSARPSSTSSSIRWSGGRSRMALPTCPRCEPQLVAAHVVAEALDDVADEPEIENGRITEIAAHRRAPRRCGSGALRQPT